MISGDVLLFMEDREVLSAVVAEINSDLNLAAKVAVHNLGQGSITGYNRAKTFKTWAENSISKIANAMHLTKE